MKKLLLCFCAVALTAAGGCVLSGDETDDGSGGDDVLVGDSADPSDANGSVCDASVPASACHNNTACDDGKTCFSPGQANCGICMPIELPCTTDMDCNLIPSTVCDFPRGGCPQCTPGLDCIPACNVMDGTTCDDEHPDCVRGHCVAHACTIESDCPPNFTCDGRPGDRKCVRKTCLSDENCGDCGWCVNGACYDEPGHCDYMAP